MELWEFLFLSCAHFYVRPQAAWSTAVSYTHLMQVDAGEKYLMSKEEALNKIATFTGGRAAEELIFHSITTGASNDIEQATKIARAMVTRYAVSYTHLDVYKRQP